MAQGPPKGSQFWKLRSKKTGPDRLFQSPDALRRAAYEYFAWCEANPLGETVFVGKDGRREIVPKMRAFTWDGLELFIGISSLRDYKTKPNYSEFFPAIEEIGKIIFTQKFTGAAAGLLNQSIIARDLGLADKKDIDLKIEQPLFGDDQDDDG